MSRTVIRLVSALCALATLVIAPGAMAKSTHKKGHHPAHRTVTASGKAKGSVSTSSNRGTGDTHAPATGSGDNHPPATGTGDNHPPAGSGDNHPPTTGTGDNHPPAGSGDNHPPTVPAPPAPPAAGTPVDAGTVTSFSGGVLTITLTGGATVTGQVPAQTPVVCRAPATVSNTPPLPGVPCGQAALVAGAIVHETGIVIGAGGLRFISIVLTKSA